MCFEMVSIENIKNALRELAADDGYFCEWPDGRISVEVDFVDPEQLIALMMREQNDGNSPRVDQIS